MSHRRSDSFRLAVSGKEDDIKKECDHQKKKRGSSRYKDRDRHRENGTTIDPSRKSQRDGDKNRSRDTVYDRDRNRDVEVASTAPTESLTESNDTDCFDIMVSGYIAFL